MSVISWHSTSLVDRIRWLRYVLPPVLILVVVGYQLGVAQYLEQYYGHAVHYGVEIAFYSLVGPAVTLLTLIWVEHKLREQEQLKQKFQARTQQLASLTDISADAILSLNAQGSIASWNRGAERMMGYLEKDIQGRSLTDLLSDADALKARLDKEGVVKNFETTAISIDGHKISVELTQTSLGDTEEESISSLIIMRDVTARREREIVREEERARIARDLHDGVAQTLYFMALKADMMGQQISQKPELVAAELKMLGQTARQVIREVRRTIFALRPLDWSEGEFTKALIRFVEDFSEQAGWQAVIDIEDLDSITPSRLELAIFRLVQESLNNAAKHAEATRVWITLQSSTGRGMAMLSIRDNGIGFDPDTVSNSGLGLNQMAQRVSKIGGAMEIHSLPGHGTIISAKLPISEQAIEEVQ